MTRHDEDDYYDDAPVDLVVGHASPAGGGDERVIVLALPDGLGGWREHHIYKRERLTGRRQMGFQPNRKGHQR